MSQNIFDQAEFYNQRWRNFKFANAYQLSRCLAILDLLQQTKLVQPRILDLGCGAGWLTAILGLFGPALGVDLSEDAIRSARSRFPYAHFLQVDILGWNVPEATFDVVVSQEVIEHVQDQAGYLGIAWRALRPGGYLILTAPNKAAMLAMPDEQRVTWSNQPIENWLTGPELRHLIASRFSIVHFRTVISGVGHKGLYRLFNSTRVENLVERTGLMPVYDCLRLKLGLGLHLVVLARKIDRDS